MDAEDQIPDQDIAQFTLDIWEESGLLSATPHTAGTFYHSALFPNAAEFNFFVPAAGTQNITPETQKDIHAFYAARNNLPMIYAPDGTVANLGESAGDVKIREVIMRADIDMVLAKLSAKAADPNLTFERSGAFTDPDYLSVYNSVFLSADSHSQYDDLYKTFVAMFDRAAKGGSSYQPWLVLGSLGGTPASAATIVPKGRLAGLYNLATKPEFRGHSLAAQTMREAFTQAKARGADTLFLITETDSDLQRTYERIGFRPFAHYSGVVLKP